MLGCAAILMQVVNLSSGNGKSSFILIIMSADGTVNVADNLSTKVLGVTCSFEEFVENGNALVIPGKSVYDSARLQKSNVSDRKVRI